MSEAAPARRLPRQWRLLTLCATAAISLSVLGGGTLVEDWLHARSASELEARLQAERVTLSETGLQAGLVPIIARPDLSMVLTDLPAEDSAAAGDALATALAVYPPGFLHRLADRVILAGNILFWSGQEVGGFYFARGIAVNCRGMERAYIIRDIHHELSSLVRQAATPRDADWTAANPPGFTYLSYDAYRAMMRDGTSDQDGPAFYDKGFVRAYGTTTLDNDYNTYAERMFSDGPGFAALIKNYPRMQAKTRLVIASYLAVDPAMGAYFDRTGLRKAAWP